MPPDPSPGGDQAAFTAALTEGGALAGVHDGAGRPAAHRFAVYRNNVVVSLRDALRTSFPATERLMGEAFFAAAAVDYARAHKPRSPLLFTYGDGFADFIAALPGLAPYPFVPEVAALEYARLGAYHAADAAPLAPDALAALPPADLAHTVFRQHPAARLLSLPAGGLGAYRQNAPEGARIADGEAADAALVTRPGPAVLITPLAAPAAAFAGALFAGTPLGTAAATDGLDLAPALAGLLSAGAFSALKAGAP